MRSILSALVLLLASPAATADLPDEDRFDCDRSTAGWAVFPPGAQAELAIVPPGALEYRYERKAGAVQALVCLAVLRGLKSVELEIWSKVETTVVLRFDTADGAGYHLAVPLPAGRWRKVAARPADFRLDAESKVRPPRPDPARFGFALAIVDAGQLLGAEGPNAIRVDAVRIERAPLPALDVPDRIEGRRVAIEASGHLAGDVAVGAGGSLAISSPRLVVRGDLLVAGGTLEVSGSFVTFENAYPHHRNVVVGEGGTLVLAGARAGSRFPTSIRVRKGGRLVVDGYDSLGASFSVDLEDGGRVELRDAKAFGEVMVFPGAAIEVERCSTVLLWLTFGERGKGRIAFPESGAVEAWSVPDGLGLDVRVRDSDPVFWGLITAPGSDLAVEGHLRAIALTFFDEIAVAGIVNARRGAPAIPFRDRKIDLSKARIDTWNLYGVEKARLAIRDSTFGECFAFGDSRVEARDSTCDGSGGYVRAEGRSTLRLVRCRILADVVARDDATVILEDCEVDGTVTASGRSTVRLVRTKAAGGLDRRDEARVEER